jgi:hypothetical protein
MGIAMIQALMPALIKSRFSDNVSLFMGLYVTAIMGGAAKAASFAPFVQLHRQLAHRAGNLDGAGIAGPGVLVGPTLGTAAIAPGRPRPQEAFFGNRRAWLLAIFSASVPRPTPVCWRGWRRTTWSKAGGTECRSAAGFPHGDGRVSRPDHPRYRQPPPG